jgi:anti-sigma B factor antagonist
MEIEEKKVGDASILELKGRLLIGDGTEVLREHFERVVAAGSTKVALDLGGVPYVDSAGLGEIVHCFKKMTQIEGKFKLLNIPKRINDLLATARLNQVIGDDGEDWLAE